MKTAGIIGGIGPESTIEYYRQIIALYRERTGDNSYPPILINSIDMTHMLELVGSQRFDELVAYLVAEIGRLARAGTDFALLSSNTPHIVFDRIRAAAPVPMISIVEATCVRAQRLGLRKLGLFGTRFTMQGPTYKGVFAQNDIQLVVPAADDLEYIHSKYMGEWIYGIILDETKARLLQIVHGLKETHGIQGLILGGTEIPLILKDADDPDIPFLDTTRIHVEAVVDRLLE